MSAIVMQQRAQQACNSCRKLKRKCTYNPSLGKCDRCFEGGKPCVYAEANPTPSHPISVAAPSTSTNAVPSGNLHAAPHPHGEPMYPNSFDALSVTPNRLADIVYDDRRTLSDGSRMALMCPGDEDTTYQSSHTGTQF